MEQAVIMISRFYIISLVLCFAILYKMVENRSITNLKYIAYLSVSLICEAVLYALRAGGNAWLTHFITPILLLLSVRFLISLTPLKVSAIAFPLMAVALDILDNNFLKLDVVSSVFSYGVISILSMVALCYAIAWRGVGFEIYACLGMLVHNTTSIVSYPKLPDLDWMAVYLITNAVMTILFIISMGVSWTGEKLLNQSSRSSYLLGS
jgi:hypothetical protein